VLTSATRTAACLDGLLIVESKTLLRPRTQTRAVSSQDCERPKALSRMIDNARRRHIQMRLRGMDIARSYQRLSPQQLSQYVLLPSCRIKHTVIDKANDAR
ncbi:MAG TPA: hypothetical protein VHJ19_12485, partial [Gammaproteobacteria bacterium]|nr:hypothetical protein [Gammaproteobacteria bacterium]